MGMLDLNLRFEFELHTLLHVNVDHQIYKFGFYFRTQLYMLIVQPGSFQIL